MAHVPRFFVSTPPEGESRVELPTDEAHHALNVLRVDPADAVLLFDGLGNEWEGSIAETDRRTVSVSIGVQRTEQPNARRLIVLLAWLGREKAMTSAVQRGTELGVDRFVFFESAHSEPGPRKIARWEKAAIESCKQCGRLWLPGFEEAESLADAVVAAEGTLLIASQRAENAPIQAALAAHPHASILIGPEGGFSPSEDAEAAGLGAIPVSLGRNTLRSEVAVGAAAGILRYLLDA